jgi:SAM-dependent methyltransferase
MAIVLRYTGSTYGDAFADVYDEWYHGVSDVAATVDLVAGLAAHSASTGAGRVLELGVGTGRLALPLSARGLAVTGVDTSAAMLARLRERDPAGRVSIVTGDMVDDLPDGPFDVVLVAYNTFFNLLTADRQANCAAAVASRLAPAGAFVVEVFVPEEPPRAGESVAIRSMTAEEVVLAVTRHDPDRQRAEGHFVHLAQGQPVQLRPWAIRYCAPAELDALAAAAGLALVDRWEDVTRAPFRPDSPRHVSIYRPTARR